MFLIHKWNGCYRLRYGINLNWGGNTIIEMVIRIPLPMIKKGRWLCFETSSIMEGIKILNFGFYFRIRPNKLPIWGDRYWDVPFYKRIVFKIEKLVFLGGRKCF